MRKLVIAFGAAALALGGQAAAAKDTKGSSGRQE